MNYLLIILKVFLSLGVVVLYFGLFILFATCIWIATAPIDSVVEFFDRIAEK